MADQVAISLGVDLQAFVREWDAAQKVAATRADAMAADVKDRMNKAASGASPAAVQSANAAATAGGAASALGRASQALAAVGKGVALVGAAVAAVNVGVSAMQLVSAALRGDMEGQAAAAKSTEDAIRSSVPFGGALLTVGERINALAHGRLETESQIVDKILAQAKAQDVVTAALKRRTDETIAANETLAGMLGKSGAGVPDRRTDYEKEMAAVAAERRKLEEALKSPGERDSQGNLTESAKAAAERIRGNLQAREVEAADKLRAAGNAADADAEALRAENRGDKDAARRIRLETEIAAAMAEAMQKGQNAVDAEAERSAERRIQLERTIGEERKAAAERAAKEQAEIEKRMKEEGEKFDRDRANAKETLTRLREDNAEARLRIAGRDGEAQLQRIQNELAKQIRDVNADPNLTADEKAAQRGELQDAAALRVLELEKEMAREGKSARGRAVGPASRTDLTAGFSGDDTASILKGDILRTLREIRDKPAGAATFN